MDRAKFFGEIRETLFGKRDLLVSQVQQINAFLTEWENQKLTDLRWLAYIFATVYHETARTMAPIEEFGKGRGLPYGKKLKYGKGPNKRVPYDTPDKLYYGRGHTQNTWYEIYEALTRAAKARDKSWDFLNQPELLLETEPSIWATFLAMKTGLYTGKKLLDYFNEKTTNWIGARYIINGQDKAEVIAKYAQSFYDALVKANQK
jgi:putative chitinase